MHKTLACSILMIASSLVACGKDKHQEPAMAPAAGDQWEQRPQTAPTYNEQQAPAQPEMQQQTPGEWQEPGMQEPSGMTDQPATSDPWTAEPQAGDMDARMLAETRCRRELRCDQIGENKKYPTVEECQAKVQTENMQTLKSCPKGLDRQALTTCVTAIQADTCDSKKEKLTEYEQCRTTLLCAAP